MTERPWRMVVAALFVGLLAAGLVLALRPVRANPEAGGQAPATTRAPASSTTAAPPASSPPSTPVLVTPGPGPAVTTTVAPPVPPPVVVEAAEIRIVVVEALATWGAFAVTGDMQLIAGTFDPAGPQYSAAVEQAADLAVDPLGAPPYVFTLGEFGVERPRPQRVIVTGPVVMTRSGEPDQEFTWRVHLRWSGSAWRLWTVEDG